MPGVSVLIDTRPSRPEARLAEANPEPALAIGGSVYLDALLGALDLALHAAQRRGDPGSGAGGQQQASEQTGRGAHLPPAYPTALGAATSRESPAVPLRLLARRSKDPCLRAIPRVMLGR